MGLAKDAIRCLAGCMIKSRCNIKLSKCCQSECMTEEGPANTPQMQRKESTATVKKRNKITTDV